MQMHAGDVINVAVMALAVLYAVLTLGHGRVWDLKWFGRHWAEDGFCISFKDTPFHTHLLCFYGDTVLALLLSLCGSERPELQIVKEGAAPHLFHGLAHLGIWYLGDGFFDNNTKSPLLAAVALAMNFLFLRGYVQSDLLAAVHALVVVFLVPKVLVFTYVNTAIFFHATNRSLRDGFLGHKDAFYTRASLFVNLPIVLAAWAEPLLCDLGLIRYGGHVLFDFTIPLSLLAYFAVARSMPPRRTTVVPPAPTKKGD